MSTLRVTNVQDTAGSNSLTTAQIYNGAAKAWVNFNGTFGTSPFTTGNGGIRASFNVSSVTDNGTGNYTITFTNAMVDANYNFVLSRGNITSGGGENGFVILSDNFALPTTGGLSIATVNVAGSALQDPDRVCVSIFR